MNQSLSLLKARIKLQQRHLQEWNSLATDQQKVLALVKEDNARMFSVHQDDKPVCMDLTKKQSARLIKIMVRQHEERQQMKMRHQNEKKSLELARDIS
jgi:hypothetical protein